jgi:hypothetical protein
MYPVNTLALPESMYGMPMLNKIKPLPDIYVNVPPATFPKKHPLSPKTDDLNYCTQRQIDIEDGQHDWPLKLHSILNDPSIEAENVSWSAPFASLQKCVPPPAITALLPLFRDNAHSLAMVKHGMDIIFRATDHVNKGQIPVITVGQPLYALAKKVQ